MALGPVDANHRSQDWRATRFRNTIPRPTSRIEILLPDRVQAMCRDLFDHLLATGGPEQKTIIFCARDRHADDVAIALNNLYADWCAKNGQQRREPYAFKCTASVGGTQYLADLRGASRRHFVATTVDLLTTGVDVPCVRNIVFFKYVRSPDRLLPDGRARHAPRPARPASSCSASTTTPTPRACSARSSSPSSRRPERTSPSQARRPSPEPVIQVEGFDVRVTEAGRYIVTEVDGKAMPVTVEEYKERLAARLVDEAPTLEEFRARWIDPAERRELLARLPDGGRSALLVRSWRTWTTTTSTTCWPSWATACTRDPRRARRRLRLQARRLAGAACPRPRARRCTPWRRSSRRRHRRAGEPRGLPDARGGDAPAAWPRSRRWAGRPMC